MAAGDSPPVRPSELSPALRRQAPIIRMARRPIAAMTPIHPVSVCDEARMISVLAVRVDGVNLKDLLRQIEPNARDRAQFLNRLVHGRPPFRWGFDNDHLGTLMPFGAVAVGTVIAGRPPHRSRRAVLPHRAPISDD